MSNGNGWLIIAAIAVAMILWFIAMPRESAASKQRRSLAIEADRLIAESMSLQDRDAASAKLARAMYMAERAGEGLLASEAASHLGDIYMNKKAYQEAARVYEQGLGFKTNPGWRDDKPNFERLLQNSLAEARSKASRGGGSQ